MAMVVPTHAQVKMIDGKTHRVPVADLIGAPVYTPSNLHGVIQIFDVQYWNGYTVPVRLDGGVWRVLALRDLTVQRNPITELITELTSAASAPLDAAQPEEPVASLVTELTVAASAPAQPQLNPPARSPERRTAARKHQSGAA